MSYHRKLNSLGTLLLIMPLMIFNMVLLEDLHTTIQQLILPNLRYKSYFYLYNLY